ncbi:hypothetical protein EDB86DRAFT_3074745 [Lactarius hatsudake]|nr:hypothetical protein EDB86DRAFT_3074745 [Lactarius hatsudake]
MDLLVGPTPALFSGDPAQAQRFIDEFGQLEKSNRCHPLVARPDSRVELALALIEENPTTIGWKRTIRRRNDNGWVDESVWDEFFDLFCTAWIDDAPMPETQTPSSLGLVLPPTTTDLVPEALTATTLTPVDEPTNIFAPAMTPSAAVSAPPPPRPPRSPRRPVSPKIARSSLSAVEHDGTQISPSPRVVENANEEVLLVSALALPTGSLTSDVVPSQTPLPTDSAQTPPPATRTKQEAVLAPTSPAHAALSLPTSPSAPLPTLVPGNDAESLVPHVSTAPTPPDILTMPRIRKRKRCVSLNLDEARPRKIASATPPTAKRKCHGPSDSDESRPRRYLTSPRHTPTTLVTDAPSPPIPCTPPPRRPCPTPDDPVRTASVPKTPRTIVEDDNTPRRGVKTLDDSVFARVSIQKTVDSSLQTPPRAHLVPRRTPSKSCNPNEIAKHLAGNQRLGNERSPIRHKQPCDPGDAQKHHDPNVIRKTRTRHTSEERHRYRTEGRNPAHHPHDVLPDPAEPPTTKHTYHKTTRLAPPSSDQPATDQQIDDRHAHRTTVAKATPRPIPGRVRPAYDAVAEHLALCLARDPDITRVTQPFALTLAPNAVLQRWKMR